MSKPVIDSAKSSAIIERLIHNAKCAEKCNISIFSIIKQCATEYDLMKIKAVLIHLFKINLCKQKEFDYVVILFY